MMSYSISLAGLVQSGILVLLVMMLISLGIGIWKISAWKTTIENRLDNLNQRLDDKFSEVMGYIKDIKATINQMPNKVNFIRGSSPLSLNQRGKELYEKINAPAIADKYTDELIKRAKERNMNTYQIQQDCFNFAFNEILKRLERDDKEQYDQLSDVAYNEGVQLEDLMQILGVILRDRVLEAVNKSHKETENK